MKVKENRESLEQHLKNFLSWHELGIKEYPEKSRQDLIEDYLDDQIYMEDAFEQCYEYEQEIQSHNDNILKSLGNSEAIMKDYESLIDGCQVTDKIEIVDKPRGDVQPYEDCGAFKNVHVDQWSVGDSGDSYAGFIYAQLGEDKWLKIPYEC